MEVKDTCCVTGASGYIAAHLVAQLLEKGYRVRATVRNPDDAKKVGFLKKLPGAAEKLELFKADLLDEGSFDEAVAGCTYVFHTASPFIVKITDPQKELVDPAKKGTENVLAAVNKAESVKRVVLTSSVAAVCDSPLDKGVEHVFTEEDWNETSTLTYNTYQYSKTEAEKVAWAYAEKQSRWTLVTINPGVVLGPTLSGRDDSTSISMVRNLVGGKMKHGTADLMCGVVDVRDVAKAHILAAQTPGAKGRYLAVSESLTILQMADALREKGAYPLPTRVFPKWLLYILAPLSDNLSWGFIWTNVGYPLHFDNSKIQKDLGLTFIPGAQSLQDMLASLVEHHIVPDLG